MPSDQGNLSAKERWSALRMRRGSPTAPAGLHSGTRVRVPSVRACGPRCRVQGKAVRGKAQGLRTHLDGRNLEGACHGSDDPTHRGHRQGGQNGLLVGVPIGLRGVEQAIFTFKSLKVRL